MSAGDVTVRAMRDDEFGPWGEMRLKLWPDCAPHDNAADMADLADPDGALRIVFLAFDGEEAVGFAELSERSVVDGAGRDPAAYLEGWYVEPGFRHQRAGAALIRAAADWAKAQGYTWLGSDAEIENIVSHKAHVALGFEETGRVVKYRMKVGA